jgi:hypothetical protein
MFPNPPALANGVPARPRTAAPLQISDFDAVAPDPKFPTMKEKPGSCRWDGGTLPFIKAETTIPWVDLPAKLVELIGHCWESGATPTDPRKTQFQIGAGARTGHIPGLKNALANCSSPAGTLAGIESRNADYRKQVHPLSALAVKPQPHLRSIVPTDWGVTRQLPRISAYAFRGDKRGPQELKSHGGFQPPITRTDQHYVDEVVYPQFNSYMKRRFGFPQDIPKDVFARAYQKTCSSPDDRIVMHNFCLWRSMVENEAYHIGRMLANETLKGYISTTRSVTVAKGFAFGNGGPGWVYVLQLCGGFLIDQVGKLAEEWVKLWTEQEIAFPRPVPWDLVFACRATGPTGKFSGPIYMRRGFAGRNAKAYNEVFELLSGKVQ